MLHNLHKKVTALHLPRTPQTQVCITRWKKKWRTWWRERRSSLVEIIDEPTLRSGCARCVLWAAGENINRRSVGCAVCGVRCTSFRLAALHNYYVTKKKKRQGRGLRERDFHTPLAVMATERYPENQFFSQRKKPRVRFESFAQGKRAWIKLGKKKLRKRIFLTKQKEGGSFQEKKWKENQLERSSAARSKMNKSSTFLVRGKRSTGMQRIGRNGRSPALSLLALFLQSLKCFHKKPNAVRMRQSPWVETGAFPWRVGGDKVCLRFSMGGVFCPCDLPLFRLTHRFDSRTLPCMEKFILFSHHFVSFSWTKRMRFETLTRRDC